MLSLGLCFWISCLFVSVRGSTLLLEFEAEAGADAAGAGLDGEVAAEEFGPAPGQGQAEADAAGGLLGLASASERPEHRPALALRHPGPAVLHLDHQVGRVGAAQPQPDAPVGRLA